MTHDRTQAITDQFEAWLGGYSPPQSMRDNPERMQDEKLSLLRIVLKFSPAKDWRSFVTDALDACAMVMKTRAWPTQNEVGAAFRNTQKSNPGAFQSETNTGPWKPDPAVIAAKKMQRGEAVGENWLYGIMACEMIARSLIDRDTITRYRSAAFFARKEIYGEEKARRWEDEARMSHERGKEAWRKRNDPTSHRSVISLHMQKFPDASDHVAI